MNKAALTYGRKTTFMIPFEDLVIIGCDTDDGEEHPLYDARAKEPPDEALVRNIMFLGGLLEPVKVRKNGERVEVVFGRRRVAAGREANRRLVERGARLIKAECSLARGSDGVLAGMMISENEQRRDDSPMAKARKLERFLRGNSEDDACVVFGVTKQTIRNWLRLLEVAPVVQEAVLAGDVTASAAVKMAGLPHEEQEATLGEVLGGGKKPTAARVRKVVDPTAKKPPGRCLLKKLLREMDEAFGELGDGAPFERGAYAMLAWVLSGAGAEEVAGLSGVLRTIEGDR